MVWGSRQKGVCVSQKSALWPCVPNFTWGKGGEHFGVLGPVYIMPCCSAFLSLWEPSWIHQTFALFWVTKWVTKIRIWHALDRTNYLFIYFFKANPSQVEGNHKLTAGSMNTSGQISNFAINRVITHTSLCSRLQCYKSGWRLGGQCSCYWERRQLAAEGVYVAQWKRLLNVSTKFVLQVTESLVEHGNEATFAACSWISMQSVSTSDRKLSQVTGD